MRVETKSLYMHAMQNVPYYASHRAGGLADLPPLCKSEVVQSPNDFLAGDYLLYPKKEHVVIRRAVGASGKALKVHWDAREEEQADAAVRRLRQEWYGVLPDDSYCYFFTSEYHQNTLVYEAHDVLRDKDGSSLGFAMRNLTPARLCEIVEEMRAFDPVWLSLTPPVAALLADVIRDGGLPALPRLRYVELTGEMSDAATRAALSEVFSCPIGNLYAATETGGIALACPAGHLHILEENVIVEISREGQPAPDGAAGDVILTSRLNYAMPLLRYQIGDRGSVTRETCACGHSAPTLQLTAARRNDFITLPSGGRVAADVFLYAITYINERIGPVIRQFRIRQTGVAPLAFAVTLALYPPYKGWKDTIQELFTANLCEESLRDAAFSFEFRDALPPDDPARVGYFLDETKDDSAQPDCFQNEAREGAAHE